jgi:dephospho-CoA kinase
MGKSTAAEYLRRKGLPVLDADAVVHELYRGAAVTRIEEAFPGSTRAGAVDRAALSAMLAADPAGFTTLEHIVHPLVQQAEREFLRAAHAGGAKIAVLEIPLLFEIGADARVDVTIVLTAPPDVQRQRVMEREGMTEAKFAAILARQMPDWQKRARADVVIDTSTGFEDTYKQLDTAIEQISLQKAVAFQQYWQ